MKRSFMSDSDNSNEFALRLHSKYQPQIEADRYINSLNINPDTGFFILIEPGLGFLIHSLQKFFPEAKIIVLHADSGFRTVAETVPGVSVWYPDSGIGVQEFLENEIEEMGSNSLPSATVRIIEWRPSLQRYGETCLRLVRASVEFIKRADAVRWTTAAFGRRWVRNFFRNITIINSPVLYRQMDMPVVITGSGPSLEKNLPHIRAAGKGVFVIAASSSLPALRAGGVLPDMVLGTDGGGWALTHLYSYFRLTPAESVSAGPILSLSLCAAVPSQCATVPLLLLSDGSLWQNIALNAAGLPSVCIPQRGTVTASALELAMVLSAGNIFLAGMDLSVNDIKSHARPNGFDYLFYGTASRMRPVYAQLFTRSRDIKSGGSLDVYASWFKNRLESWQGRVFSLTGNHEFLEKGLQKKTFIDEAVPSEISGGCQKNGFFQIAAAEGSPKGRVKKACDALTAALNDSRFSKTLTEELAPLLFPSNDNVHETEIAQAVSDIALRYRG